jgi:hypothetical protein
VPKLLPVLLPIVECRMRIKCGVVSI